MKQDQSTPVKDIPGVIAPPPLLAGGGLVLGWLLDWLLGWHLAINSVPGMVLGALVLLLGLVPILLPALAMRAAKTPVEPWKPTRALLTDGLYKFSRNPIYIGLMLVYLGLAIITGSGSAFVLLPVLALLLHFGVVLREEAYLTRKFGDEYCDYCKRVPRWLPKGDA